MTATILEETQLYPKSRKIVLKQLQHFKNKS